ncbi:MAG: hypothetical protein CVV64_08180 [Candidatus Wallbacteria bacterium HGW-Wallbacteria-1]|jgi:ATP-binding cassette subfamily B protein|uniref:ABC transporter ATP-binding protein n=1 Tax=Candidatus Wallbacteria bacterium HGW-Wallbacteria-1 TaxID=2013854 RepID=A0A2N1PR79_9BACT|nr:MAG: hypothetical protein CVV64_08180 [Candidatus Wallbacteria bacterium HGW-Wallbacteria-1]
MSLKSDSNSSGFRKAMISDIFKRVFQYRKSLFSGLSWTALFVLAQIFRPVILKYLVDTGIPSGDFSKVLNTSILYGVLLIVSVISSYNQVRRLGEVGVRFIADLKSDLFDRVISMDMAFFSINPSGSIMARLESDSEQVKELFSAHVIRLFTLAGIFLMAAVAIGTVSLQLSFAFSIATFLILVFLRRAMGYVRNLYHSCREAYKEVSGFLAEYIRGIPTIQAFRVMAPVAQKFSRLNSVKYVFDRKVSLTNYSFIAFLRFLTGPLLYSAIIFGLGRGHIPSTISVGTLIMVFEYCRFLFEPLYHLTEEIAYMQNGFASTQRIYEYMALEPSIRGGGRRVVRVDRSTSDESAISADERDGALFLDPGKNLVVRFEDVWFAYRDEEWVLQGINIDFRGASRVGVVGPSGSGKTTIAKLLLRFHDPQKGRITLNGIDIRELNLTDLRSFMGLIMQDQFFFPGTLGENIRISGRNSRTDQEIASLLMDLGISSNALIESGNLDEVIVAERGSNFSSGERQIISLARVFDRDPGFLIMDEATAFVDHGTERDICRIVSEMASGRGQLIIAHRLSTILDANIIYVLKSGVIQEQGTHDELMARTGLYRKMFETQMMTSDKSSDQTPDSVQVEAS